MNTTIKKYIENHVEPLKGKLYPLFTTETELLSGYYSVQAIGKDHVNTSQFTVTVVGPDYDECDVVAEKVADLLGKTSSDTFTVLDNILFYSQLSGGGYLFNDTAQLFEVSKIFIIKWRYIQDGK